MIKIQRELIQKEKELQDLIKKLKTELRTSPKGSLRISKNKYGNSYYHCLAEETETTKGNSKYSRTNGRYIRKKNMELARALAQKSYEKKLLAWAEESHKQLVKFMDCYQDGAVEEVYFKLPEARKQMVEPIEKSVQEIVREWEELKQEGKPFQKEDIYILTEKGERVRSKSEKILADKFFIKGIPYKYEQPLRIDGYGLIYPDFTLLNVHTGKIYYWEHFGMVDDQEYAGKMIRKIEGYERNGIFPGKQLIMTFETRKSGLNTAAIEMILREYFSDSINFSMNNPGRCVIM